MLIEEHLRRMAETLPDETAYTVVDIGALSFADWDGMANAMARRLVAEGLKPGDRVGIYLHPETALRWLVSYTATHRAGGVAVPMNSRLTPADVRDILTHSGATVVVTDGSLMVTTLAATVKSRPLVIDATLGASAGLSGRVLSWSDVTSGDRAAMQVRRKGEDLADILYTSGTPGQTGRPKGVGVRHSDYSMTGAMAGEVPPTWSGEGCFHVSPLSTFVCVGAASVYTPMKLGLRGIFQPNVDGDRWVKVVEDERPVAVFLDAVLADLLLDHPEFATVDLTGVPIRSVYSVGNAPLEPVVVARLQERMMDAAVSNHYGTTKAGFARCTMPKGEAVKRPGSVGRIEPPTGVRIVDANQQPLAANEVGEVRIQLPGGQRAYVGDAQATVEQWKDGWLTTGDLGKLDDEGYLYIVGRGGD